MKGREAATDERLPAAPPYSGLNGPLPCAATLSSPATRPRAPGHWSECQALDMNFLSSGVGQKPIFQEGKPRQGEAESE